MNRTVGFAVAVALMVAGVSMSATSAEDLATAGALYNAADYQGALIVLDRISAALDGDMVATDRYRALCYIALGDTEQATHAIERLVVGDPGYRLAGDDVSPRIATLFREVRRQALPSVVKRRFTGAKHDVATGELALAEAHFREVLGLLNDPDFVDTADLRSLVEEYLELIHARLAAATTPVPVAARPVPSPPETAGGVVPPVVVAQQVPRFTRPLAQPLRASITVDIGEDGHVASARMLVPTNTPYDELVLEAARQWQYRPALLNGKPVAFEKTVNINITPSQNR